MCLFAAADDRKSYDTILGNLSSLLKMGGYVFIAENLQETRYIIDNKKFPSLYSTKDDIKTAYEKAGFKIEMWKELIRGDHPTEIAITDYKSTFVMLAKKVS
jgi:hypothetical protein